MTMIALVGCGYVADMYMETLPSHDLQVAGVYDRDAARLSSSRVATLAVVDASRRPMSSHTHTSNTAAVTIQPASTTNCHTVTNAAVAATSTPHTADVATRARSELPDQLTSNRNRL